MDRLTFEGRVVIVTGAGRGIGRAHALLLAERGATVVVNDLGSEVSGLGSSPSPADEVATLIRAEGGQAVANGNSVATREGAEALVDATLAEYGRIDALIHNAGFNIGTFDDILNVHLRGAFWLTERCWPAMIGRGFGRIVLTTSAAVFGDGSGPVVNPKQPYVTAKMGIIGLTKALATRGASIGVSVNAIAPTADTRLVGLNAAIVNPRADAPPIASAIDWVAKNAPARDVAAASAWLAHERCPVTGRVFAVGAGRIAEIFLAVTRGYGRANIAPEDVLSELNTVIDRTEPFVPIDMSDYLAWVRTVHAEELHPSEQMLDGPSPADATGP